GAIRKDGAVVIAVRRRHITAPALRLQTEFAHQPADLLIVDDDTLVTERSADPAITISLELVADRLHAVDDLGVSETHGRHVVEGRPGQTHQPTSLREGETVGPTITDVVSLLGRGALVYHPGSFLAV